MIKNCIDGISTRFAGVKVINNVVMPNHIHAVLYSNGSDNLSEVVRQPKAVTSRLYNKSIEKNGMQKSGKRLWQRSFYDAIIRNQQMFDFINNYISINPERWEYDKMNEKHLDKTDDINKEIDKLR